MLGELVRHGRVRRAFIGISAQQTAIPARRRRAVDLVQESAVMVATVESGSAADRAGLKPGDIVLRLDGEIITGADDLIRALTGEKIGKSVALDVLRGLAGSTTAAGCDIARRPRSSTRSRLPRSDSHSLALWNAHVERTRVAARIILRRI